MAIEVDIQKSFLLSVEKGEYNELKLFLEDVENKKLLQNEDVRSKCWEVIQNKWPELENSRYFILSQSIIELNALWEMTDPAEYTSYIQWLPRERLEDATELSIDGNLQKYVLLFSLLIEHDVIKNKIDQINVKNECGRTYLHQAVLGNQLLAYLLLQYGADVNARDFLDQTPLHLAAGKGNVNMVRLLLQKGAMLFADKQLRTPLHLAILEYNQHTIPDPWFAGLFLMDDAATNLLENTKLIVDCLLKHGADVNAEDKQGQTAITLADTPRIQTLLRQYQQAETASAQSDPSRLSSNPHGFLHNNQGTSSVGNNLSNEGAAQPGQKLGL